jgi:hypothetical protein
VHVHLYLCSCVHTTGRVYHGVAKVDPNDMSTEQLANQEVSKVCV